MSFTAVTITHDFDLPDTAGALGTVEFTPAEPMHNGASTVSGTRRAVLAAGGVLSQVLDATTDPGTTPPGVPYRIVVRLAGQPTRTYYGRVPHDQGAELDLSAVLAWAQSASSGSTGPVPVVMTAVEGVITPNASLGSLFRHTADADVQLDPPTGGTDGQEVVVEVKAVDAARTLSFAAAAYPAEVIPSGEKWSSRFRLDTAEDRWFRS